MRFGEDNMEVENRMKTPVSVPLPTLKDIIGEEKLELKQEQEKQLKQDAKASKNKVVKTKSKKIGNAFLNIVNGDFLTQKTITEQLPFALFLAVIAMVYIANGYYAEHTVRKINNATKELKELHSEYITTKSSLMQISTQSSVAGLALKHVEGLQESKEAPKKIVVKKALPNLPKGEE